MEGLLKVETIVNKIASCLNTTDYLNFQRLNKDLYNKTLSGKNDQLYWSSKLVLMGLKAQDASTVGDSNKSLKTEERSSESDLRSDTIFDTIKEFTKDESKNVYRSYFNCFNIYCVKLLHGNMSGLFVNEFEQDPLIQGKIIQNLFLYNESNSSCFVEYSNIKSQLTILKDIFVNSALKEAEISYNEGNFVNVGKFIRVLLILKENSTALEFIRSKYDIEADVSIDEKIFTDEVIEGNENIENSLVEVEINAETPEIGVDLNLSQLEKQLSIIQKYFNDKIEIIDTVFEDKYTIVLTFAENLMQRVVELISSLITVKESRLKNLPVIYQNIKKYLVDDIKTSVNGGEEFRKLVLEFLNLYIMDKVLLYFEFIPNYLHSRFDNMISGSVDNRNKKEKLESENIINVLKNEEQETKEVIEEKHDLLRTFNKMFKINSSDKQKAEEKLKFQYNLNVLSSKLVNMNSLVDLDLCVKIIQEGKESIEDMYVFHDIEVVNASLSNNSQKVFRVVVEAVGVKHLKPAFKVALELFRNYNEYDPNDISYSKSDLNNKINPLLEFLQLISIGDLVLQMVSILYKKEIRDKSFVKQEEDFLNSTVHCKKNLELMVDDFVGEGLNIGLGNIMKEVRRILLDEEQRDYIQANGIGGEISESCGSQEVVKVIRKHCRLLKGATDKGTLEVFQQEIGERLFREVVEMIKNSVISTDGAVYLISDLNYYFEFVSSELRQRRLEPLFGGLKSVGQIFIVSGKDSKDLGKMIGEVGMFGGIFSQEEIYEFVQRREDWVKVRKEVEKAMYGFGAKDCSVM
ncbi:hypothetical protein Kpol_2002p49 [Vanderwaltozyma polyspora DSM 70294]|uniref:Exocyst complex component Sec10-like alpha-helical bundle domain-containing protein n=1 Tax=Vanderwaltozyma polyspora (strain ATCC 22028 / DSM 70294 / BCRC 21397 / CBS 2163 / NBRC 10782 / NRRL Y-8283 / UCD 57-17) TaxID=436907 RepID=A7TFG4_VANPO|nr:uncharacterized protein Kpol_2002p49 [Vanderwaltozyma polyspora DSM 70294]EDO18978.1 hypothetical protein Kpol_2002p49 [Vanderwaltozyma polyspora DSM 70294]